MKQLLTITCFALCTGCGVSGKVGDVPDAQTSDSSDSGQTVCPADSCVLGSHECAGDAIRECITLASGCPGWGAAAACPNGQACSQGQCSSRCAAPAWFPRTIVDIRKPNATEQQLYVRSAVDHAGHIHVVYIDGNWYSGQDPNQLRYITDKSGQLATEVIAPSTGESFDMDVDPDGTVHVAYTSAQDASSTIIHQQLRYASNPGGSWRTEVVDGNGPGSDPTYSINPQIKADAHGNAHIVYTLHNVSSAHLRYATNGVYYSNPTTSEGGWSIYNVADSNLTGPFPFQVTADGALRLVYMYQSYLDAYLISTESGKVEETTVYQGRDITYAQGDFLAEVIPECVGVAPTGDVSLIFDDRVTRKTCNVYGCKFTETKQDIIELSGPFGGVAKSTTIQNATTASCATDGQGARYVLYADFNLNQNVPQGVKVAFSQSGTWSYSMVSGSGTPVDINVSGNGKVSVLYHGVRQPSHVPWIVAQRAGTAWSTTQMDEDEMEYSGRLFSDDAGLLHATYMHNALALREAATCTR